MRSELTNTRYQNRETLEEIYSWVFTLDRQIPSLVILPSILIIIVVVQPEEVVVAMYFSKRSRAGQAASHQVYMMNMRQGVRLSYAQQSVQNIPHSFFRSMSFHSTNKTSTHSISPSHLPQNTQRGLSLSINK